MNNPVAGGRKAHILSVFDKKIHRNEYYSMIQRRLNGYDAPTLNTLFVDKNLRYHGLIQAYSRTNRILNKIKTFGNIVWFRDLEQATKDAIKTFGDKNSVNIIRKRFWKRSGLWSKFLWGFKSIGHPIESRGAYINRLP